MTDLCARTITLVGYDGDEIEAYLATPLTESRRGGVVVIHHNPGYDRATREIVRRFAEIGYDAVVPNLHHREAPGAAPGDAAAVVRSRGGVPDDRLLGDVSGAVSYLRSLPSSNGKIGVIGFCSGGRQSLLAACNIDVDAAVNCYGAFVLTPPAPDSPLQVAPLDDQLPRLRAPVLGLFGVEDRYPSPEEVEALERMLAESGKEFELHSFEGAGHAFFSVDRPSYDVAAANRGWELIQSFFTQHLGG